MWSKVKQFVKNHLRVPQVEAPGVGKQRLVYLENIVDQAKDKIVADDCANAIRHTKSFHSAAIAMDDMCEGT